MLHAGVVAESFCINTFHAGMVGGVGEPGVKEWGEGVAEPKPVTKRPGGDHEERGEEEVNEIAPPGKEAGPGGPARTGPEGTPSAPQRWLSIGEWLGGRQPAAPGRE